MSNLLKKATKKIAFAKVGIYGDAGSGKTVTSSKLAIGLHEFAKLKKPVAFFDTEGASDFVLPLFENAGIELMVAQSRSLSDLMQFMDEAEKTCSTVIIDSVTHVWKDCQDSYIKKINDIRRENAKRNNWTFKPINQIEFQDWRVIKSAWAAFTDRYLSSKLHCFVCGRSGSIYEYQENERTGKKELINSGTKMATEKELGYEPSLLIELSKVVGKDTPLINRAFVEKDRNVMSPLTGKFFDFPDFKHFKSHFDFLNLNGEHFNSLDAKDSRDMFEENGQDSFSYELRQRKQWSEEVAEILKKHYPSQSVDDKKQRADLLEIVFKTRSWTKVENMNSSEIKSGFNEMRSMLEQDKKDA